MTVLSSLFFLSVTALFLSVILRSPPLTSDCLSPSLSTTTLSAMKPPSSSSPSLESKVSSSFSFLLVSSLSLMSPLGPLRLLSRLLVIFLSISSSSSSNSSFRVATSFSTNCLVACWSSIDLSEIATRKEEFEEELLEIERKMTNNLDRSRNGPRGDIRDRLDTSKNEKLDDTFDSKDGEDDEGGFMADRVVVERDGERQSEVNGGDLRMTLKNNTVTERKKSEERTVIVKDEREVEERKKRKEEEKQKEEERRIRKEEEKRREQRKAEEEEGKKRIII